MINDNAEKKGFIFLQFVSKIGSLHLLFFLKNYKKSMFVKDYYYLCKIFKFEIHGFAHFLSPMAS